jgi:N6-adenosine-specific RNA methylase IME4
VKRKYALRRYRECRHLARHFQLDDGAKRILLSREGSRIVSDECQYQLLPDLTSDEYAALKDDIAKRGVQVPVEYDDDGNVLDGHHRLRACADLGIKEWPRVVRVGMSENQKAEHVLALNLDRRHLNESQRAMIAAKLANAPAHRPAEISAPIGALITQPEAAEMLSVGKRSVQRASVVLEEAPPDVIEAVEQGRLSVSRAAKEVKRERAREQNRALVEETAPPVQPESITRYPTIVLDPPWDWGDEGDADQFGRARPTYHTMTIDEIRALPISDLAADNAHIYLWITNRSLPKGFDLLAAWGFRYIVPLTWCKPHFGMGNYYRGSTEQVLFGVRGSLALLRHDAGTWFEAPRGSRHSSKPDVFYELVETCSPGPWLEMFARQTRPGWQSWGAEA